MKKILLLLSVTFLYFGTHAQSVTENVFENDVLKVEMVTGDCNYHNQAISHTYGFLKYTNKTDNELDLSFEIKLWYNGVLQDNTPKDGGDESAEKYMILGANETRLGNCDNKSSIYRVFYKHNHPEMNNKLTKIQFVINKIK